MWLINLKTSRSRIRFRSSCQELACLLVILCCTEKHNACLRKNGLLVLIRQHGKHMRWRTRSIVLFGEVIAQPLVNCGQLLHWRILMMREKRWKTLTAFLWGGCLMVEQDTAILATCLIPVLVSLSPDHWKLDHCQCSSFNLVGS